MVRLFLFHITLLVKVVDVIQVADEITVVGSAFNLCVFR